LGGNRWYVGGNAETHRRENEKPHGVEALGEFARVFKGLSGRGVGRDRKFGQEGRAWTPKELAFELNVSARTVRNWSNGTVLPASPDPIVKLFFSDDETVARKERRELRDAYLQDKAAPRPNKRQAARVGARGSSIGQTASTFTIMGRNDLKAAGWTMREVAQKMNALDYKLYENLTFDNIGTPAIWLPILTDYPQNWRILVKDNSELIGYWQTAVFLPRFYEHVKDGNLIEGELTPAVFDLSEIPGVYNLYFISVCLDREHCDGKMARTLLRSFFAMVDEQAKEEIFFDEVLTIGYSDTGLGMCEAFKMEVYGKHSDGNDMYVGHMKRILERCSRFLNKYVPGLIDRYRSAGFYDANT
jgi:hypothetical protein